MQRADRDQDFVHASGGEGAVDVPSPAPLTLDLDAPVGHTATSAQPSRSESDVAVGRLSTPLAAPSHEVQPWNAEQLSAGPVDAQVSEPAAGPATSRQTSRRALHGSETAVQDEATDVASGQEEVPVPGKVSEARVGLSASSDSESESYDSSVAGTEEVTRGAGSHLDVLRDGRIPAVNSDSTTHGDHSPYIVDLFADDKMGLIPSEERSFRGKLDTGSEVNILATSMANRMKLMAYRKPVDPNYRIRGLSRSAVPVRGQLTITVDVYYELIEFSCRAEWLVVDDKYINGSFDALVGLPVIRTSEKLGVLVFASRFFGNTSSGAAGVDRSDGQIEIEDDGQIEIEDDVQDPGGTTAATG